MEIENYSILKRENNDNYPLLEWVDSTLPFNHSRRDNSPVDIDKPIQLRIGLPIPIKPEFVDFHVLPEPVISNKLKNALEPLYIDGIQILPAKVNAGESVYDYWLMHIYRSIKCLDVENSIVTRSRSGRIIDIDKLVLDEAVLTDIPLSKRLVFVLRDWRSLYLVHNHVVDVIFSVNPVGVRAFPAKEWNSDVAFK